MAETLLDKCSLLLSPSGYKSGVLYSVIPDDGTGDFTFTRSSEATRTNSEGLIETMGVDVPRLQYPSCPSLLLEPSRENFALWSEDLTGASWYTSSIDLSIGDPSPIEGVSGSRMTENTADATHRIYAVNLWKSEVRTFSCYAKSPSRKVYVSCFNDLKGVFFDIQNGVVEGVNSGIDDYTMTDVGNGWWKLTMTASITTGESFGMGMYKNYTGDHNSDISYQGDGVSYADFTGMQMEEGTYPTTYIKTEGSTEARAADACSLSGLQTNGILGATDGTVVVDCQAMNSLGLGSNLIYLRVESTGNVNSFYLSTNGERNFRYFLRYGSATQLTDIVTNGLPAKFAFSMTPTAFKVFLNGALIDQYDGVGLVYNFDEFSHDLGTYPLWEYGEIQMYPTALSDEELIELTT